MNPDNKTRLIIGLQEIIDRQKAAEKAGKRADIESEHMRVDQLLLDYIDDKEISDMINELELWYA